jgi:peptide/nickel transport system substrate-binding protein
MRRRTTAPSLVAVVAIGSLVLAACGSGSSTPTATKVHAPTSHTLTLSFLGDPGQPPDPAVFYAGQGSILVDNVYQGLLQYAPGTAQRKLLPVLATSWSVSPNYETYTLQLRQGVTFHDGTPFTSAAIAPSFAFDAAVDGGPAYMAQAVASIETPGPYTVVFHLKQPNSSFLDYLASEYGPRIYSPTGLAKLGSTQAIETYLETHDLGTGPYTLTKAQVGVDYQLKAYPGYWGPKPYYTTVNFPVIDNIDTAELELERGTLAAILHGLPSQAVKSYAKDSALTVDAPPTIESQIVYVNPASGFLTSAAARRAVLHAIDQKAIVADVYPGRGTVGTQAYPAGILPAGEAAQDDTYDPSLLEKLVAKLPASERAITVGYDTGSTNDQLVASIIATELDQAGLQARSVGYETSTIYGWAPPGSPSGAPALLVEHAWPDAYDPYQWAHIIYDPSGGINFFHCTVPGTASQLNQAVETGDQSLFSQVGTEAVRSGCWLNLVNRDDVIVAQRWLRGVDQSHVVAYPRVLLLGGLYPAGAPAPAGASS